MSKLQQYVIFRRKGETVMYAVSLEVTNQIWAASVARAFRFNTYDEAVNRMKLCGVRAKLQLVAAESNEVKPNIVLGCSPNTALTPSNIPLDAGNYNSQPAAIYGEPESNNYNPDIPAWMRDFVIFQPCNSPAEDPGEIPDEFN